MKRVYLLIFLCVSATCFSQTKNTIGKTLCILDNVIKDKQHITQLKEERISRIKFLLEGATSDEQQYRIKNRIFNEYHIFCMDSSEVYALKKLSLAKKMKKQKYIDESMMNMADVYGTEGMYLESLDCLKSVNRCKIDNSLYRYYYHLYRTIYGFMSDYSTSSIYKKKYTRLKYLYRDSLLSVQRKNTYVYAVIKSDLMVDIGKYEEAIRVLTPWLKKEKNNNDAMRTLAYTLALSYRNLGDSEKEEYYLIVSSIADLRLGNKEYLALLDLSKMLYKKGDLKRAYNYLKCTMVDAAYCNARLRTIEVSEIFPIIEKAYRQQLEKKERQRSFAFICVSLLSLILIILLVYLNTQKSKLSSVRKELIKLNGALQGSNNALKKVNSSLMEANYIKEGCILGYIELCSLYIEKMHNYQHSLLKIGLNESLNVFLKRLRSAADTDIENELKDFYFYFDKTFLELFPTFVEDFNSLLLKEARTYPKVRGQLNTELRVFALIRLGVSDSKKIAKFLRCSITTIYNYRVKARNAAVNDRNQLEGEIMRIGELHAMQD